jgi:hypothetical protein
MFHMLSATQISAIFSILSPLTLFLVIPLGLSIGGGPAPIDFGNPGELARLRSRMPRAMLVELLALAAPVLALGAGYGWWVMLAPAGSYVGWAVVFWYLGMIFIVLNDALELALAARLPVAYEAADESVRPILLVFGASMSSAIEVLGILGGIISFFGVILVAGAMLHFPGLPVWLAWIGLASALILFLARVASAASKGRLTLGPVTLVGFVLFMIWMLITGGYMWGWAPAT